MPRTILVADDNLTIQRMAAEMLAQEGVEVVTVANGMAAIKKLPSVKPLVVLADANMPGKDGYEVCNFVKSSPEFGHVRALLVVGDEEPYDEARGARAHVDGIIRKPFDREQLIATVAGCLDQAATLVPTPAETENTAAASHGGSLCSAGVPTGEVGDGDIAATVGHLEEWRPEAANQVAFISEPETEAEATGEGVMPDISLAPAPEVVFEPAGEKLWADGPETLESVAAANVLTEPPSERAEFRNDGKIEPPPVPETAEFPGENNHAEKLDEPCGTASEINRDLVVSVVNKVVARMAPSAFSPEMIRELERTLTEEILFELSSNPAES